MASKTSTETKREITKKGDVVIIKEVETTTTYVAGKEPEIKEVTRVEEFKGEEGFKRLPEEIRRQLEDPSSKAPPKALNRNATRGNFVEECLAEHNRFRKMHGVDPLKLSKQLIKISEARAKELAQKDEMSSRGDHIYGENLSCLWSNDPEHFVQAPEIMSRWYNEHANYNFDIEPTDLNAGHFTQMIWEACKEMGVAAAKSDSNKIYVVCTYSPPGNYVGEFRNNVHPAGYSKSGVNNTNFKWESNNFSRFFFHQFFHWFDAALQIALSRAKFIMPKMSRADFIRPKIFFQQSKKVENKKADEGGKTNAGVETEASLAQLNKEGVESHNEYRSKHGVPPLKYNKELADFAQEWAEELAKRDKMEHRKENKYGENIYTFKSSNPDIIVTAAEACKSWYSEIKSHDFKSEPKSTGTGHFTQMIWKTTTEVGMGRAKSKSGFQYIVANYKPPGNFIGTYKENVPPPK